jgi:hypothetical protein
MIQRHKRHAELFPREKDVLLAALRRCRDAIIESHRQVHPWSPTYQLGGQVIAAIDALAGELTGNPKIFHAGSQSLQYGAGPPFSTPQGQI